MSNESASVKPSARFSTESGDLIVSRDGDTVPDLPAFIEVELTVRRGDWQNRKIRWRVNFAPTQISHEKVTQITLARMLEFIEKQGWRMV